LSEYAVEILDEPEAERQPSEEVKARVHGLDVVLDLLTSSERRAPPAAAGNTSDREACVPSMRELASASRVR
jgi:hypothetical protein